MNNHEIYTTLSQEPFSFVGKYRRDLETENWHYYETEKNEMLHFKKEHIVAVISKDSMILEENKASEYKSHEYCKATNCAGLNSKGKCVFDERGCVRTAKQFHRWLNENGFIIVKKL